MGEVSSIVTTKQQIAVYKWRRSDTAEQGSENRLEVVEQEKGIHKSHAHTDGYKPIRREVDAEPGAKACSPNIPQSALVAADKAWAKTDFDRGAHVHDLQNCCSQIRT